MNLDKQRWVIVLCSLIIQINLGTLYTWSIFKNPLIKQFGWDPVSTSFVFSIIIVVFYGSTIPWGRIQDRFGPRWVATCGGVLYGLSILLASQTTSLIYFYLTYGVIGAIGIGAGYVCPLATCMKWFPDKRGFITGIIVAGFGLGAMIFTGFVNNLIDSRGVLGSFEILGWVYGTLIVVASQFLRNPPKGYTPAGWTLPADQEMSSTRDFEWTGMMRTRQFWIIALSYIFGANTGLMIVSNIISIATTEGVTGATALFAVTVLSLCNSAGRIGGGLTSDKFGRLNVLKVLFLFQAIACFAFNYISGIPVLVMIGIIGICWGGFLAIFPSLTADYFGIRNLGMNYGCVFFVLGLGTMNSSVLYDLLRTSRWVDPIIFCGILSVFGFAMMFVMSPPRMSIKYIKKNAKANCPLKQCIRP